jgi:hypothetical protein
MKRERANRIRLLLDSGAYTAWRSGGSIDVKDYIAYCVERKSLIHKIVNLDVIPGHPKSHYTAAAEVEESAKRSYSNQQRMKEAGLASIPVFHQGERLHWLEQMLRDGEPYIGLSPRAFYPTADKMRWLDSIFNLITDSDGRPLVRTHGFACTSLSLIASYPWRSVDSTTWSLTPGYGQIIVPALIDGKFDYRHATRVIMSGVPQKNKGANLKQFENMAPAMRDVVEKFIKEVVGSELALQRYSPNTRRVAMLAYYLKLNEQLYDMRHSRSGRIYGPDHFDASAILKAVGPWNTIHYFATEARNHEWSAALNQVGADDRLISYWSLRKGSAETLDIYMKDGRCEEYVPTPVKPDWKSEIYRNRRRVALFFRNRRYKDEAS